MPLLMPRYTLTPACKKDLTLYFQDQDDKEIPWITYNSTAGEYQIFSDDIDVTGTHIIKVNAGVKNY